MALAHARPGEKVNLPSLAAATEARAVALVKTKAFEAAQLVLRAGDEIARHAVPGYATIQCLDGAIVLETNERIEMSAGDWLYLDRGEEHTVSAVEDGSLLVTILFE
jgi:quercetin dioxygenase-like cupin family protein